ncbi:Crp/Fnr family transcriptional regulator [Chitinophaga sp. GbtcB8]|uniref:Crp/Fnr family transcriptional regulator n=1 Tax=Chitinophaga sp. GbtcB8 TaxID=2824753 RepID=UPI001C2FE7A1|nr:Crp/Fnr family transcriptional regulator [Chitinophaga sp. GbtcB8]
MKENLIAFLTTSSLVTPEKAAEIAGHFTFREIPKNAFFLEEGKIANNYLFLEKGFMRVFAYDMDGNDVTTGFAAPRQVVLEVSSFFNRTRSQENIQALTDCEGWGLTYDELNQLFHARPEFREFGRHVLVNAFTTLKTRMLSMITETAEQRYTGLLNTNPAIFQHAPLKNIASYLGITDTSLSRIRKEFSKK